MLFIFIFVLVIVVVTDSYFQFPCVGHFPFCFGGGCCYWFLLSIIVVGELNMISHFLHLLGCFMTQDMVYLHICSMITWKEWVFCCFWLECPIYIYIESIWSNVPFKADKKTAEIDKFRKSWLTRAETHKQKPWERVPRWDNLNCNWWVAGDSAWPSLRVKNSKGTQ